MTEAAAQIDTDAGTQSDAVDTAKPEDTLYDAGKPATPEAKPDEAKAEDKPAEAKPDEAAATEIQDFIAPEGVELDAELSDSVKALAKDKGWDQETAQAIVDLGLKQAQKFTEAQQALHQQTVDGWLEATKTDKEIGANLEANTALAAKARDQFTTPEFRQFLNDSGLGNHPEMIRAFMRIGKAISEDSLEGRGTTTGEPKTQEKKMYPDMN